MEYEEANDKTNLIKLCLAFMYMAICLIVCTGSISYTNYVVGLDQPNYHPPLHDILLDHITIPEYMFICAEVYILILFLISIVIMALHKCRLVLIRRYIVCFSTVFLMRGLFLLTTQPTLPYSTTLCPNYKDMDGSEMFGKAFIYVISMGFSGLGYGSCGDLIFSGHTASIVMVTFFISYYTNLSLSINVIMWVMTTMSCLFIILSRGHYTLDVFVGFLVSIWIFTTYHAFIKLETLKSEVMNHQSMVQTFKSLRCLIIFCNFTNIIFEDGSTDFDNNFFDLFRQIKRFKPIATI
ncbi:Sphingomyelin synthase-related 1 [Thelohanellus kitauei]|uniref:Sphingomyelin synthase-related 1 n=1 Tax=Thelohanellus kitauei TaxID=669202 RepID=A0A0C2MEF6_THEKT|nr:Sphingomyelin synthase-related 1 [Thelohanellus kitauei]